MSSIHEAFPMKEFPFGMGYTGNYKKALELLEAGADPNELNEEGFNLLHLIGEYWRGRDTENLMDFFEYMPQVLEKALPLMKDKGINQKLKTAEEYKDKDYRYSLIAGDTPLHFAIDGWEERGFAYLKAKKDTPHYIIKTMTWSEIDKKCRAYCELFLTKLLAWGADKTLQNDNGENPLESISGTRQKISVQNKLKKILDKY